MGVGVILTILLKPYGLCVTRTYFCAVLDYMVDVESIFAV